MTQSTHLALPYLDAAQAQKHVTHNEALQLLDALVQLAVISDALATPPGSPAEGDRYIVAASPTGAWAGKATQIAAWQAGAWLFYPPKTGWRVWIANKSGFFYWTGSAWVAESAVITVLQNLALLGVGTTADAANPLSAKLNAALFVAKTVAEGGTGDLRYTLNKESAAKILSFLFQTNFSGRAEIGLTGDDDLHVKVSPDGAVFKEAMVVNKTSAVANFPFGVTGLKAKFGTFPSGSGVDGLSGFNAGADTTGVSFVVTKDRSSTVARRYSFFDVGGVTTDTAGGFWRGVHYMAPSITDPTGGANVFPAMVVYAEYNSITAPSSRSWILGMANDTATSRHTFRVQSNFADILTASAALGVSVAGNLGVGTAAPTAPLHVVGAIRSTPVTVGTLPAAGVVGAGSRHFVTDALAPVFGATVAAGGAVLIPVYSDGTNWKVG